MRKICLQLQHQAAFLFSLLTSLSVFYHPSTSTLLSSRFHLPSSGHSEQSDGYFPRVLCEHHKTPCRQWLRRWRWRPHLQLPALLPAHPVRSRNQVCVGRVLGWQTLNDQTFRSSSDKPQTFSYSEGSKNSHLTCSRHISVFGTVGGGDHCLMLCWVFSFCLGKCTKWAFCLV